MLGPPGGAGSGVKCRRSIARSRRWARAAAVPCVAAGALSTAHLLTLLLAAIFGREEQALQLEDTLNLVVVVPAHDEESQIESTLRSIEASRYPVAERRVVVVADNCTDRTAEVARAAGAEVWERFDPVRRGKGYALSWAFPRLVEDPMTDAICVIDADCEPSPNLLELFAARLAAGAEVVQAPYLISNPEASNGSALRWAGFALFNLLRPLGRHRLGLSSGLLGTGMAFSRGLLRRSPWSAFSYAEDREQHMRWVLSGARVELVPRARVLSPAPIAAAGGRTQSARWDSGRGKLAMRLTPRLIACWLRTGELRALDAALEPLLPPQSLLLALNLAGIATARLAGSAALVGVGVGAATGQFVYVVGGLAAVGAPRAVWRALLTSPIFGLGRAARLAGALVGSGPADWERTHRDGDPAREETAAPSVSAYVPAGSSRS